MTTAEVISSDPDVQGGTPVFTGTRVPFKNLIDYLQAGDSLEEFLKDFPAEEHRVEHAHAFRRALQDLGADYVVIGGEWDERFRRAVSAIDGRRVGN